MNETEYSSARPADDAAGTAAGGTAGSGHGEPAAGFGTDMRLLQRAMEIAGAGIWEWDVATDTMQLSEILRSIIGIPPDHGTLFFMDLYNAIHPQDREQAGSRIRAALHGRLPYQAEFRMLRPVDGRTFWIALRGEGEYDAHGAPLRMIGVANDVSQRRQAQDALQQSEVRFRTLVESTSTIVWLARADGGLTYISESFERYTGKSPAGGIGDGWLQSIHPDDRERTVAAWSKSLAAGQVYEAEFRICAAEGGYHHFLVEAAPLRDAGGEIQEWIGVGTDIGPRKQAEAKLEQLHRQLADSSRRAGMAEIATNVLHNVGNVLNSVNVSANLVAERFAKSKISGLARVNALLREHDADLAAFIGSDPRGRQVPGYLEQLAGHLHTEQAEILKELDSLRQNIDHIKKVVAMQQNYAKVSGISESVNLAELLEDSLRLNEGSRQRHGIEVVRRFEAVPQLKLDKHKVLQILVNLLSNAKHACDESGRSDKQVTLRLAQADGRIRICVSDNGVGIAAENLTRIFNHGFTTRKAGHGFGLHSGALAAKELGGTLTAHSEGLGKGATLILELPTAIGATGERPQ